MFEETATVSAPSMLALSKQSTITTTTQLFKKQRLRLNPTFTQHQHTNTTSTHIFEDEAMGDDRISLCDDNDNSIASEESMSSEESFANNVFADITESHVESDYSCFTTSQQCVTSLMYLLDEVECPDYAFQTIMD